MINSIRFVLRINPLQDAERALTKQTPGEKTIANIITLYDLGYNQRDHFYRSMLRALANDEDLWDELEEGTIFNVSKTGGI